MRKDGYEKQAKSLINEAPQWYWDAGQLESSVRIFTELWITDKSAFVMILSCECKFL